VRAAEGCAKDVEALLAARRSMLEPGAKLEELVAHVASARDEAGLSLRTLQRMGDQLRAVAPELPPFAFRSAPAASLSFVVEAGAESTSDDEQLAAEIRRWAETIKGQAR
jgi:hypothetical protein